MSTKKGSRLTAAITGQSTEIVAQKKRIQASSKGGVAVAQKPAASSSKAKSPKEVNGVIYTKKSETTPFEKFKSISDATPTSVTGRRPGFVSWSQLGIKKGQVIFYKGHPEIKATVQSEVTNQLLVEIPEQDGIDTAGVVQAEKAVRSHLGTTKNGTHDGFDMWGFHLEEDGKTYWRTVYDLYCAVFRKY